MEISGKKRKAILRSYPGRSIKELAQEHQLSARQVRSVLIEAGVLAKPSLKKPLVIAGAVLAVVLAAGAVAAWLTRPGPGKLMSVRSRMNVLVVTLDTLRADHLSCYGYDQMKTPNLDALADSGVRFEHAFALQPLTLPSHTTIFTGTHPAYHGVEDNGIYVTPDAAVTLAETLKGQGYVTHAIISSFVLNRQFGLAQGFDFYDDRLDQGRKVDSSGFEEMGANSVSDRALKFISDHVDQRWMLWLHYYDIHADYQPPPEYARRAPTPYDGEIAYVDDQLGRVLKALDDRGLRQNTLIVVTADHGESLGEHGEATHGMYLYDSVLHVPLIIALPGAIPAHQVRGELVSLLNVMPTVLDAAGIEIPASVQGRSLKPLLFGEEEKFEAPPLAMQTMAPWDEYGWSPSWALRDSQFKYIRSPKPELYDLQADPRELDNLYDENKGRAEAMSRLLEQRLKELSADALAGKGVQDLSEEAQARLESLGYVFSGGAVKPSLDAPDVKDMIFILGDMNRANELNKSGHLDQAIAILQGILRKSPESKRVMNRLGVWYAKSGRSEQARQILEQLLVLDPNFREAYVNLGQVYLDLKQYDQAQAMAQALLSLNPNSAKAHNLLGMSWFHRGQYQQAIAEYQKAVKIFPTFHEALANLGAAYANLGDLETALQYYSAASRIMPSNRQYQSFVQQVTKALGR